MEEKQKKTKKVNKSNENDQAPKAETVTKKPKTRESANTKKETKASPKSPKTEKVKKEATTSKTTASRKTGASKANTVKKEQPKPENDSIQKKQPKEEKSSAPKEEKKEQKAKKNYIDISIGAIVCVAIIIGLIILNVKLGTRAYNVITKNNTASSYAETDNNISVTQEVGNVLSNTDELVIKMKEKITFAPSVTASIYDAETFSTNTISNDLKLKLGWAITKETNKLKAKNEKNNEIEAIEKETMAENIKNILGPNVKYRDESFDNTNISTFSAYSKNQGTITYSNGIYTSIISKNIETNMAPLIYQEIQKVMKYTDKVIVYVKVAYMDVEEDNYIAYKDFSNGKFEGRLLEIMPEELFGEESFNSETGEGTVTIDTNTSLDGIRSKLDTYKYTFSLDEETEEYYLTKFNKALSMQ